MKKIIALFAASLLSTGALAGDFNGNPDLERSPLNDHGGGAPSAPAQPGEGDLYGSLLLEGAPHVHKCAVTQRGEGDRYGSILLGVGAPRLC